MNFFDEDFLEFKPKSLCSAWVATAIVGSAVVGAGTSLYASSKAADTQASASQAAAQAQAEAARTGAAAQIEQARIGAEAQTSAANTAANVQLQTADQANKRLTDQFNLTRGDLSAYRGIGTTAAGELTNRLGELTAPVALPTLPGTMTQEELEATPGYQFTRTQGLKAVQNSAAARGLGVSGAALKGAATFATGLADQTYLDQFGIRQKLYEDAVTKANLQMTNQGNAFNRLKGLVDTGENASAQGGVIGNSAANAISANTVAGGNALAAGINTGGTAASTAADTTGRASSGAATATGNAIAAGDINAANAQAAGINASGSAINNASGNIGGYLAYKSLYGPKTPTAPTNINPNNFAPNTSAGAIY